jgi:hypothetical protein
LAQAPTKTNWDKFQADEKQVEVQVKSQDPKENQVEKSSPANKCTQTLKVLINSFNGLLTMLQQYNNCHSMSI